MRESIKRKADMNQSRYKSFMDMNPHLVRPNLYNQYIPADKLLCVTRLRTVSHDLAIETGRHSKVVIPRESRLCTCGQVEDERHFVLNCPLYIQIRQKYNLANLPFSSQLDAYDTPDFIFELNQSRQIFKKL